MRKEGSYAVRFSGGRLGFLLWQDGQPASLVSAKTDWTPETWHHVAATYDGRQMRLFVDGREDAASPKLIEGPIDASASPLGIGSNGSGHLFCGIIDRVRLYDRALSADEVRASCEAGREAMRTMRLDADRGVERVLLAGLEGEQAQPAHHRHQLVL